MALNTQITQLRDSVTTNLGYTDQLGNPLPYNQLTAQQQIDVVNAEDNIISQNPDQYSSTSVQQANKLVASGGISDIESQTPLENAVNATVDYATQVKAAAINDVFGPILKYLVIFGIIFLSIQFFIRKYVK